jgi:STE24 endopeptidase
VSEVSADADRSWIEALATALALAEGAALVLRPGAGLLDAAPVDARDHFDASEIARARRYALGGLGLAAAGTATETALLVYLVWRERRRGASEHTLGVVAGRGAALALALTLASLPTAALTRRRALRVGLATQSWRGWAVDVTRSAALAAAFAAAGAVVATALRRRFGARWWAPVAAGSAALAVVVTFAGPIVLEPLFNEFTPLAEGELRRDVLALAERAGVHVGEVYEVDASRRTSAANAYVSGIGATRRIVLFDTLVASMSPAEARVVVAHELAHVAHRDVPRLLVFLAATAPAVTRAVARLAERLAGSDAPDVPSLALAAGAVSAPLGVLARQLSRAVERRADLFSLELTGDPRAFIAFEERVARQNLADPDPPRWLSWLLGTHPSIVERIGIASAYEAGTRATRRPRGRPTSLRTRAGS